MVAAEKIEDVKAEVMVVYPSMIAVTIFFLRGQFWACIGSSGPSNSTTYSSRSGNGGGNGFPAPKLGIGFLEARLLVRLRTPDPTVCTCCERAVAMRLSSVGWRSRSFCVETRDMLREAREVVRLRVLFEDVVEVEELVRTCSISLDARLW